jgi:hypothetical protein
MTTDTDTDSDDTSLIDPDEQTVYHDTHADGIEDQYVASEPTRLREEAVTDYTDTRAKTVRETMEAFETYVHQTAASATTHAEQDGVRRENHVYSRAAADEKFAKTLGVDRAARRLWGEDLTTAMVVRRSVSYDDAGEPQPPADQLNDLLGGNDAVYRAYKRQLRDTHDLQYARLTVLEPHADGYAHVHDGFWIHDPDGVVCPNVFDPVIDAHLENVPAARPRNHSITDAVSVRHNPARLTFPSDPENVPTATALPRELCKYLPAYASDTDGTDGRETDAETPPVLDCPRGRRRFYALLWARGPSVRQWRPSQRGVWSHLLDASRELFDIETTDEHDTPSDFDLESLPTLREVSPRPVAFSRPTAD